MITVYIISNIRRKYWASSELAVRIARHKKGQNKTTKPYTPFKLVHTKELKQEKRQNS